MTQNKYLIIIILIILNKAHLLHTVDVFCFVMYNFNMNKPTEKILKAINLASDLHRNQYRQDENKTPYVSHLFAVAMYLASITDDEDVICAGLMHDSLEDVPDYTYDDLVSNLGEKVASIVRNVTEEKSLPYKERKIAYIDHLKNADLESVYVSLSDKIHNAKSYNYMPDHKKHIGHEYVYKEVLNVAKEKIKEGDRGYSLVLELEKSILDMN